MLHLHGGFLDFLGFLYSYTELEVSVPDIGIVGLHAENLGIESVLVDGEPAMFEYYPHHQNSETESNWNSVSDPASAADAAAMDYIGVLKREDTANLLINCCKPSKDLSEQLDNVTLENGSQSSGEAKQVIHSLHHFFFLYQMRCSGLKTTRAAFKWFEVQI